MHIPVFKQIAWYLVGAMFIIGIAPRVEAGFSPSAMINTEFNRDADMAKVQQVIETKLVRERLEKLGFTQDEITSRLSQLSDRQLHQVAQNLDDIRVGGDGLGIIIALLVIAILVVLLIQLTGHRVIVK
jgi:hypothetical protein